MKKNEFFVPELIKRTIPAHTKDFQTCERIVYDSEEEAKLVLYHIANYKKVMIWKSRTTKYLNHPNQPLYGVLYHMPYQTSVISLSGCF